MSLKYGDAGPDVGAAQQALIECGHAISQDELGAQRFGVATTTALRAFQAAHVGPDGHALAEDGIIGPATSWALDHPNGAGAGYIANGWRCSANDARAEVAPVLKWALAQIGEHEIPDGSNRSKLIDVWTGRVGQPPNVPGPPWCAYFVSAAFKQADGGSPFGVVGSAWKLKEWAAIHGRILGEAASVAPQPGDCFIILRGDNHGHVGIIGARLDTSRLATIEGNCGNAVRGMVRDRSQFTAIVRPIPLV